MWFLIKTALGVMLLGSAAYFAFFTPLGEKPLAAHVGDVWSSQVMQEKVSLMRVGVQQNLERKLEEATVKTLSQKASQTSAPAHTEISEADRRALERLLSQSQ